MTEKELERFLPIFEMQDTFCEVVFFQRPDSEFRVALVVFDLLAHIFAFGIAK